MLHIKDAMIRHKTLFRFISTVLFVALGLFIFYGWSVLNRSQKQVAAQREQQIANVAFELNAGFIDQYPIMLSTVRLFQRETNVNRVWLESQFYNFIILIDELADYKKSVWITDDMFLVLRNASYVLSSRYKYSADYFFDRYHGETEPFEAMLRDAVYDNPVTELTILSGYPYGIARLYIAVPFRNAQAVVLFSLSEESIKRYFTGVMTDSDMDFLIYDKAGVLLFSSDRIKPELMQDEVFLNFINKGSRSDNLHVLDKNYIVAQSSSAKYGLNFVVIQEQPLINQSLDEYYAYLQQMTMMVFILLTSIISLTIYINFLPIAKLVKGLNIHKKRESEFDTISSVLSDYENETEQMQATMKDHILHRLVEGHNVTDDVLAELNLQANDNFCVLAMADVMLTAAQSKQMMQLLEHELGIRIFITTLPYESYTIVLGSCANSLKQTPLQKQRYSFASAMQQRTACLTEKPDVPRIGVGMVVMRAEDIHRSYLSALTAIESSDENNIILYEKNMELGFSDLESDSSKLMMALFKYMQQGDRVHAQIALQELFDYVQLNASSLLVQKYFCYNIINIYMKHAQKNNFQMTSEISEAILHGDNPQSLFQSMLKSINEFCSWITQQQEKQQHEYVKQIADYVDENFSVLELSLEMIAEQFNLSIYMVSRMLKEYWHCGYKEYLTAKRIRYSKQLLEESSMSITDIAAASGFSDAMHFSRAFRANTGISPTQYRKITISE